MKEVINNIFAKSYDSFFLLSGPCAVESFDVCAEVVEEILSVVVPLGIPFVFKASVKKANRTRLSSFSSIGLNKALYILERVRSRYHIPVITDVHESTEVKEIAQVVDCMQIPAFLCRQTDLIIAAADTGLPINIKKGQFMSADNMRYAVEKVASRGNPLSMVTERGNSFGYQDIVVDFRNIPILSNFSPLVVLDCTHSTQRPNQNSGITGGNPEEIALLMSAGIAARVDGLFLETHPRPEHAFSDGANMLPLAKLKDLLQKAHSHAVAVKNIYD